MSYITEIGVTIGKGYTQADLPQDTNERFAYMTALITANEKQVEACRDFIRKYCDTKVLKIIIYEYSGRFL